MEDTALRLAVIIGSVRSGRVGPVVANWFLTQLKEREDFTFDVIDLAALDLPATLDGGGDTASFSDRVDAADAFVIVTPEYNHGYPGGLKTAIDTLRDEWRAKAVGFVSYGGTAGGLRSVQLLKPVLTELQAVPVRRTVSLHGVEELFDDVVSLRDGAAATQAAQEMLTQLAWWGRALREARQRYGPPR